MMVTRRSGHRQTPASHGTRISIATQLNGIKLFLGDKRIGQSRQDGVITSEPAARRGGAVGDNLPPGVVNNPTKLDKPFAKNHF